MKAILNEQYVEAAEPLFSSSNRAFRYGDALFETIKVIQGKPQFLERHLFRLIKSMGALEMEMSDQLTLHRLEKTLLDLLQTNAIHAGGRIRLAVYRKDGGYYAPLSDQINVWIEAEKGENEYPYNSLGHSFELFETHKKPLNQLSMLKSSSALLYVLASRARSHSPHDELILINDANRLCEATASNLFLVKNKVLFTPLISEGVLPGIMREHIIQLAKSNGIKVKEVKLEISDLEEVDEVFTTNSIAGIQWYKAFRKKRYFNTTSKKLNRLLHKN